MVIDEHWLVWDVRRKAELGGADGSLRFFCRQKFQFFTEIVECCDD